MRDLVSPLVAAAHCGRQAARPRPTDQAEAAAGPGLWALRLQKFHP